MIFLLLTLLLGCSQFALAQVRIVGAISGTVQDPSGAVIPHAKVVLKDEGTGITKETTANSSGGFLFPDLSHGLYQVTVSLAGFQTAVLEHVTVETSRTTDVVVSMKVGDVSTRVTVEGSFTPIMETTSNLLAKTVPSDAIAMLPITSRSTLNFARLVPGAQTPLTNSDTHYNNLAGGAVNVTFDGINNASNGYKSGGTVFYTTVPARLGAVEEVSVETGGLGADAGGQSGINVKFITKRGTNQYHGSLFYQPGNEQFNANSWSRNANGLGWRNKSRTHQFGGNIGGRLVPFGRWKDRLFFFLNFEDSWSPSNPTNTNGVLLPAAQQGVYSYKTAAGEIRSVNVLQIAAVNGYPGAIDPIIRGLLDQQNKALQYGYTLPIANNYNSQNFSWNEARNTNDYYPTTRLDYQIARNLAFAGTWNLRHSWNPGRRWWPLPDAPKQDQFRIAGYWIYSAALNWSIAPRTFNEFRYGVQHSGDTTPNTGPGFYSINGRPMRLGLPYITPMVQDRAPITGRHYITTLYDTATLVRDKHTITIGGAYRRTDWKDASEDSSNGILGAPAYNVGTASGDPVGSIFSTSTLPGIVNTDIGSATSLYALLTGRLSSVRDGAVVDPKTLKYGGSVNYTWTRSHMGGVYAQDKFRVKPNLTLNYGLRWEMQGDMFNVNGISAFPDLANFLGPSVTLFRPGLLSGNNDPVNKVGQHAYRSDLVNPAPNFGFAWNPKADSGILGKLLGGSKTVIRASWAMVIYDEGSQMFATSAGNNPGKLQSLTIVPGQGAVPYGITLQTQPLPAYTAFPTAYGQVFHQSDFTFSNTFRTMKPDLRAPYTENWNLSIQREVAKNTVLEVRYVGTASHRMWRYSNMNEVNIFENGFLPEFVNAQKNLAINQAAGVSSFASRGLPGQAALPILEAAFGARGSQPALSTSQGFGSTGFITALQNGTAGSMANSLATSSTYVCRMFGNTFSPCTRFGFDAPGVYPINFWLTNPFSAGSLNWVEDSGWNSYNGLQLNLRRQNSKGLAWQVNYTFSKSLTNLPADSQNQAADWTTRRNLRLDRQPSQFDQRHVFQTYGTYDLPFGKGHFLKIRNAIADRVIGGWTVGAIMNIASGSLARLTSGRATANNNDAGVILANGMTLRKLQDSFNFSRGPINNRYSVNKDLIAPDGRANPTNFVTPTAPGQWGQFLYVYGKNNFGLDASINKEFRIRERMRFSLWGGATNVLNHPIWNIGSMNIQSASFSQTGGPANGARSVTFRGVLSF